MGKRSALWKHFVAKDKNTSMCRYCDKVIKSSGNTSNMRNHMQVFHLSTWNEEETNSAKKLKQEKIKTTPENTASTSSQKDSYASPSEVPSTSSQTQKIPSTASQKDDFVKKAKENIQESFSNISSFKEGGKKYKKLTEKILFMVCKDCEPLSIVEREGFTTMMKYAVPNYKIPNRKSFTKLLDEKYKKVSADYKQYLRKATDLTLTTDVWTETMNTRSFLGVTAHFTHNGQITSAMLGAYELSTSHTAEHLKDKLKEVCEEWGIALSKITAIVTDNGANIVKAVDLFLGKNFHLACCAHTLNLIAERSIKSVEGLVELLQKVRTIVTWFKHCVNASDDLRRKTGLKLKQDVPTRWNSTFYMIERFIFLRGDVNEIVNNYVSAPAMITAKEIEELRSIAEILRPLEAATTELCGEKYVTASTVIPLIHGIRHEVFKLSPTHDSALKLRQSVLSEIEHRFGQVESVHFFAIACLLDPRFKKLHFNNPLACSRAINQIKENMRMIAHQRTENLSEESDANGESKNSVTAEEKPGFSVWNVHHDLVKKVQSQKNDSFLDSDSVTDELNMFLKSPITPFKSDPIRTWLDMTSVYPILSQIALKYLSVVATSVPCERLFSKTGQIMMDKRNRMKGATLNKLLFLGKIDNNFW